MPIAKDVKPGTLSFLLGGKSPLPKEDALLACVAALAADGSFRSTKEICLFALKDGLAPALVREAVLHVAPIAGFPRAEAALAALAAAAEEHERPQDPLAQILGGPQKKGGDSGNVLDPNDERPQGDGSKLLREALGARAHEVESRLERRSRTLARWTKDVLYGGAFARGPSVERRILLTVAALFSLDLRNALEELVRAAKAKGLKPDALWALHDLLARLFHDGGELKNALHAFENVLGRKVAEDEFAPGKDPFRWD